MKTYTSYKKKITNSTFYSTQKKENNCTTWNASVHSSQHNNWLASVDVQSPINEWKEESSKEKNSITQYNRTLLIMQCIVVWMDVKVFRFCNLNAFYCKIFAAFVVFTMLNSSSTANVYLIWAYVVNTTTTS